MKSKHPSVIQIIRHVVQFVAFLLFPELFITVIHALGNVVTALTNGEFSFHTLSSQLITIAAVFLMTAVWGRFFCGYLCSFGALQEFFFWISQKLPHKKNIIPARLDQILQYLKYLVLAFIAVVLWMMALPMDASLSPWGTFGMLISGNLSVMAAAVRTWGFVLLLVFLIGSLLVERFFCRYFCPLGALFTLISGKRCYKIRRDESTCIHCGLCEKACGMGVSILKKDVVSSGKCIDCMQCLTICPKECLSANPAPAVAGTAAAITMCGLVQIGNLTVQDDTTTLGVYHFAQSETGNYVDGVYTGVGAGFRGDTEVQVTVENGYITDITVLSYEDDTKFFQEAQSSILNQILSEQSIDVQNVSGATFSCNSIIDAVANALGIEKQAEEGDVVQPDDQQEDNNSTLELSSIADGTYQGEGEGFRGTISVSVTVENGKITDITVVSYEDDESFFVRAEDTIISEIINAQSLDVSCVSGATFSSNGILEAVADALNVDFDNPNQYSAHEGGHGKGKFGKRGH
ncbi:MAG TPA: FMN-binding protein [Candidatus Blautia stercoravium]|nr:FMN-binding protein [Candidatus Blautia stercoravium]